jgi:glutathione S-transferase
MTIVITAFERSPDGGMGLARDTRVRWALEEVGLPYEVRLVSFRAKQEPPHRRLHPFGLIPTYEEGDLTLFETGAIVLHIADSHAGLFPDDANARARAITWMFAALNTVEPPILELVTAKIAEGDKPWAEERLPLVKDRICDRLIRLSAHLGGAAWLDGAFSAGDLMMVWCCSGLDLRGFWASFLHWLPMSPAARSAPPTNGLSPPNGRSTPFRRKLGDESVGRRRRARGVVTSVP